MQTETKKPLLSSIQLLRFLAAFGVMLSHVGFGDSYLNQISFNAGVNLFLCIGSFLMMYTTESSSIRESSFIKKRLFRLIPLYWVLTICTFVASFFISSFGQSDLGVDSLLKSMFCIPYAREGLKTAVVVRPIVGPAWTLEYDIWFLFIFTLSMKISHKWRGLISSGVCILLMVLGNIISQESAFSVFLGRTFWLNYIAGIVAFYIWKNVQNKLDNKKVLSVFLFVLGSISLILLFNRSNPSLLCIALSVVVLLCYLISLKDRNMPRCILSFGKISYSFYLTHYYVILIFSLFINLDELSITTVLVTGVIFVVCLIVAQVSYYVMEKKTSILLSRFI